MPRPTRAPSALVTGAAGGIGREVARRLADRGHALILSDVDESAGAATAVATGGRFVPTDVRLESELCAAVALAEQQGPLTFVNLGAGLARPAASVLDVDVSTYRLLWSVNVDGVWFGIRAVLPALRRAGGGRIVVTASLAGLATWPDDALYTATKHAVVGMVRALGPELESSGVSISAVCPGFVDTPMVPDEFRAAGYPLLTAGEVADAIVAEHEPGAVYLMQPGAGLVRYRHRGVPGALAPDGSKPPVPQVFGGADAGVVSW